jgi:hypothetical protein
MTAFSCPRSRGSGDEADIPKNQTLNKVALKRLPDPD